MKMTEMNKGNKKRIASILTTAMLAAMLAGCGGGQTEAPSETPAQSGSEAAEPQVSTGEVYEIAFSSHNATGTISNLAVEYFADLVKEKSEGRIQVTFYQDGTLANELEAMQMVKTGEIQMCLLLDNFSTQLCDGYDPCIIPFVFNSSDDAAAVYDEANLGDVISQVCKDNGNVYLMGVQKRTPRLLTAKSAIETPDQLAGINIRVPQIDYWCDVWNGLGAVSTVVDWNETYQALQTGVVDCQENPIDNIYANKIYEVNSYVMMTEHQYGVNHWVANVDFVDGMDEDMRAVLQECIDEACAYGDELLEEKSQEYFDELESAGSITVVETDKEAWRDRASDTIDKILNDSFAPAVQEYVKNYMNGN
ncbi:MAG: TRAP transporter substrate-binding protein [Lachnospiraceae bacterium]|jgi:tripartite ATP-independent transporter DctP family solute receptor|nr:TRAP transporter substrate-binding protein [Lachnospiraceae bacterium]